MSDIKKKTDSVLDWAKNEFPELDIKSIHVSVTQEENLKKAIDGKSVKVFKARIPFDNRADAGGPPEDF